MENLFQTINDIISSPYWGLAFYLILFCLAVFWLSLVVWTFKDARKRIEDPLIVGVSVATSLVLPYLGTVVYAILRPAEYLAEVRERELEMRAIEQELQMLRACPSCGEPARPDYMVCPSCRHVLRAACSSCGRAVEQSWRVCPYCAGDLRMRRTTEPPPPALSAEEVGELFERHT